VTRTKDMTRGQGAELVLDMVGVNPTLKMAGQLARVLGHLTIVGLGSGAVPVNFHGPAKECSVSSPYWGYIPELMEVVSLAQAGKIKMLVEHLSAARPRTGLGHVWTAPCGQALCLAWRRLRSGAVMCLACWCSHSSRLLALMWFARWVLINRMGSTPVTPEGSPASTTDRSTSCH
jgi:hypothetical protein